MTWPSIKVTYIAIVGRMVPEIEKYFVTAVANTRRYECTTRVGNTHTHFTFIILLYDMTSRDKKLFNWTCTSVRGDRGCTTRPGGASQPVGRGPLQRVGGRCSYGWRSVDVTCSSGFCSISWRDAPLYTSFTPATLGHLTHVLGPLYLRAYTSCVHSPAALASLHSRYMSAFISGLSSAIVSPTVTNRSMAKFTPWPTLAIALAVLSVQNGRSRCATNVDICNTTMYTWIITFYLLQHICSIGAPIVIWEFSFDMLLYYGGKKVGRYW